MKLKKLTALLLALTFTLSMAVFPAAADGTLQVRPGGGASNYEIRVSGSVTGAVNFTIGQTFTLDPLFVPQTYTSSYPIIRSLENGVSANVKQVKDVRLNNAQVTQQTISIGAFESTNTIVAGTQTFTWSATIVLFDGDQHPVDSLGLNTNLGGITYLNATGNEPTINFGTYGNISLGNYRINEVRNASSTSTLPLNQNLTTASYLGNGTRMDSNAAVAVRDSSKFDVTLHFNRAATGVEAFGFSTDLSSTIHTGIATSGSRSMTIPNVPKSTFFNEAEFAILGNMLPIFEYTFKWMRITNISAGNLGITGIDIAYSGTASPSTGTNNQTSTGDLKLNFNSITLNVGADQARIRAEGYSANDLKFSVASPGRNNDIVTIYTSGRIWARRAGTATINVRDNAGALATVRVTVRANPSRPITRFEFSGSGGTVYEGSRYNLLASNNATVNPTNHNDTINWYTSDRTVATIDNGRMTVVGTGRVTITAVTGSGIQRTRTFTSHAPDVSFSPTSANVRVGQTARINATARPSSDVVLYRSLNQSVATVSSTGVVTGVSAGSTTIEVYTNRGALKTFSVTVRN
ncbi:MAG: Ig-like domain-containing protein [Oscillospiraceae bacterium]|nr:Ig-like domain-containing protein [Oscillospiraceae bacterium]